MENLAIKIITKNGWGIDHFLTVLILENKIVYWHLRKMLRGKNGYVNKVVERQHFVTFDIKSL